MHPEAYSPHLSSLSTPPLQSAQHRTGPRDLCNATLAGPTLPYTCCTGTGLHLPAAQALHVPGAPQVFTDLHTNPWDPAHQRAELHRFSITSAKTLPALPQWAVRGVRHSRRTHALFHSGTALPFHPRAVQTNLRSSPKSHSEATTALQQSDTFLVPGIGNTLFQDNVEFQVAKPGVRKLSPRCEFGTCRSRDLNGALAFATPQGGKG